MLKMARRCLILKRKRIIIYVTLIIGIVCIISVFTNEDLSPDLYFLNWDPVANVSCHYEPPNGFLKTTNDLKPSKQSIFFHETSCRGLLTARQACTIESTLRANPSFQINIFFSASIKKEIFSNKVFTELSKFPNINFLRLYLLDYAKGTPLFELIRSGILNRTKYPVSHTADILRYVTLYKYGGVYLDLDVVVAKPFTNLVKNWAARENDETISAGALAFSDDVVGRKVADAAVRDIAKKYRGDIWSHNGPGVITRVLKKMCSTSEPGYMSSGTCNGFHVYPPEMFYPIPWKSWQRYFEAGDLNVTDAVLYHVWNHMSEGRQIHEDSPYAKLAKKYCPSIYNKFTAEFLQ